jgi:hypothetical protein
MHFSNSPTWSYIYLSPYEFTSIIASIYKKPPAFAGIIHLKESDLKNVEKAKLKGHHSAIEEFYPYCGKKGLDFLLSKVMLYFLTVAVGLDWNWEQTFDQLPRVLKPTPRKAWEEVCHKHPDL